MRTSTRRWILTAAAGLLALGLLTATASAAPPMVRGGFPGKPVQAGYPSRVNYNYNPWNGPAPYATLPQFQMPINPNYALAPGLSYRQAAYNQAVTNYGTYANTPYAYYNPYVTSYNYNTFGPAYPAYNPYYNPYANYSYGNMYLNPYAYTTYGTGFGY